MTNEFEGYLAVTSLIIDLEQKLKVFWNGGEQGFTKQASKLKKKKLTCVHVVNFRLLLLDTRLLYEYTGY